MKKLGKIKLNELSKKEIEIKEMNIIRGGGCSTSNCWCPSVLPGGMTTSHTNSDGWYQLDEQSN